MMAEIIEIIKITRSDNDNAVIDRKVFSVTVEDFQQILTAASLFNGKELEAEEKTPIGELVTWDDERIGVTKLDDKIENLKFLNEQCDLVRRARLALGVKI
jgi:hypothetical protein